MEARAVEKSVRGSAAGIEVRSKAPFAIGVVLFRDESSQVHATVVAKATYELAPGRSALVSPPDPIRHPDEYWDDGASGSLRFPSDLAPFKGAHEVLVVGHAYPKGLRPADAATARLVVGDIEKMITATTPRRTDSTGRLEEAAPQPRFSLRYELAAGSADNPVGVDPSAFTPSGGHALPQLVPPNRDLRPGDYVPLVGLGPVGRSWPLRDALLRPADRQWLLDPVRRPRPRGFDARFFCSAPLDQRTKEPFPADARLVLEGLHPKHERLVTNLAGVRPVLRAIHGRRSLPALVADTLFIDTDRGVATLAFRATLKLGDEKLLLEIAAHDEGAGASDGESTTELDRRALGETAAPGLPFAPGGEGTTELDRSALGDLASAGLPFPPASERGRASMASAVDGALPFRSSKPPLEPPPSLPMPPSLPAPSSLPLPAPLSPPPPAMVPVAARPPLDDPPPRAEERDRFRKAFGGPKPARVAPVDAPAAPEPPPVPSSVRSASDAAASAPAPGSATEAIAAALQARIAKSHASAERLAGPPRRSVVDLLSFEPTVPGRLKRSKVFAPLLVDPASARTARKVDEPAGEPAPEDRARLDVTKVLSCGAPVGLEELQAAFDALLDDPTDFEIPLFLVEGEIKPIMDEVETLRVAADLGKPLAGANKRVQAALAAANEALAASAPPVAEVASALYKQLEAATSELSLPSRHLPDLVDRTLREARSFKRRTLFGEMRIRADLTVGRATTPIYLPDVAAAHLPLLPVFPIAALVELRPREDAAEQSPTALLTRAFGRVLRSRK